MTGDELRVVTAFADWLTADRWCVELEKDYVDVFATRDDERLYAEAKGRTTEPGLDLDTLYGQLLRRMPGSELDRVTFAVVVPTSAVKAALRVPHSIRVKLSIRVFSVDDTDNVAEVAE